MPDSIADFPDVHRQTTAISVAGDSEQVFSGVGDYSFVENDNPLPDPTDDSPEPVDPNQSDLLRDKLKGQTDEHADPPRLEDQGQSGG